MALEAVERNGHNLHIGSFDSTGEFDTPVLEPVQLNRYFDWVSFNNAAACRERYRFGVHFFIDDYLFERFWNWPARYLELLKEFPAVMTPDFSLFTDWPLAVQIYNHFRKHQLGAYMQANGIRVIPTICWGDWESYSWCFDGEPIGGTVAVSSVGARRDRESKEAFVDGYREMMDRLSPSKIIFFGDVPSECEGNIEHHAALYEGLAHNKR